MILKVGKHGCGKSFLFVTALITWLVCLPVMHTYYYTCTNSVLNANPRPGFPTLTLFNVLNVSSLYMHLPFQRFDLTILHAYLHLPWFGLVGCTQSQDSRWFFNLIFLFLFIGHSNWCSLFNYHYVQIFFICLGIKYFGHSIFSFLFFNLSLNCHKMFYMP